MPSITITNPEIDQEAAALIAKAYEMITPHWREIIPSLTVMIADQPFNKIPELHEFCEVQNKEPGWGMSQWKSVQVICPEIEEGKAVLWIHFHHIVQN